MNPNAKERLTIQRVTLEERRTRVMALRVNGASHKEISTALDISAATVRRDVKAIVKELRKEQIDHLEEYHALTLAAINRKIGQWSARANTEGPAFDRWLKALQERAKLLGLYPAEEHSYEMTLREEREEREEPLQIVYMPTERIEDVTEEQSPRIENGASGRLEA